MGVKKFVLSLDNDFTTDFHLIAIHTVLEDFRLAFHLNRLLQFQFQKSKKNTLITRIEESKQARSYFSYQDDKQMIDHFLIENKHTIALPTLETGLFPKETETFETFFVETNKKADYFLVIKGEKVESQVNQILSMIKTLNFVSSSYLTPVYNLKQKNYLLFTN